MSRCGILFRFTSCPVSRFALSCLVLFLFTLARPQASPAQGLGEVVITNSYANIRSGPGTSYRKVGKANRTERFPAMEKRGKWYRIMYKDQIAWVFGPLVHLEQVSPQEAGRITEEVELVDARIDRLLERIDQANTQLAGLLGRPENGTKERGEKESTPLVPMITEDMLQRSSGQKPVSIGWA
ncbi:MAG: SH3 domain-containing protein, partial [Gemmatimonadota bacterium]|nr:SH3 domain-containing protein [Gemmatimonadota bacterium]